jgi:flagellum-specific peptidoglycan hydrolase FlgJ
MTPQEFITAIAPAAVASEKLTGISAAFVIAQGALESEWDKSGLALSAMNLFGVKADKSWLGETVSIPTKEFIGGKAVVVPALWRKYPTWQACLDDHAVFFVVNPRYAEALKVRGDPLAFAAAIVKAGYCTDPDYVSKITAVIHSHTLTQFDMVPA